MTGRLLKYFFFPLLLMIPILFLSACTGLSLRTLPSPEPAAKLRVFFLPVTDPVFQGRSWAMPHPEFVKKITVPVRTFLQETDIYEVIPQEDIKAVLGETALDSVQWETGGWRAAREVGRALHADYVIICQRGFQGGFYFRMLLVNLETGIVYETSDHPGTQFSRSSLIEEYRKIVRASYREIFAQAKGDMLATALRKGRMAHGAPILTKPSGEPTSIPASAPAAVVPLTTPTPPSDPEKNLAAVMTKKVSPSPPPAGAFQKPFPPEINLREKLGFSSVEDKDSGKPRIVIYDLEAPPLMQVAGLIITEALREAIHKTGSVDVVNREDLSRAMDELKLQQSGLVQGTNALQMGRWLAARQSVTGRLGSLGNVTVLQAKRTDIETMGTLSFGSLTAPAGREEEILNNLPELAQKLLPKH
jgi:hypothetical protein